MKFTATQGGVSVSWDGDFSGNETLVRVLRTMDERFPTMGSDPALDALAAMMKLMPRAEYSGDIPKLPPVPDGAVA